MVAQRQTPNRADVVATPSPGVAAAVPRPARSVRRQPELSPMGRWVEVLNAFQRQDEWGVRDLAAATGLPRSAVHRILHEMVRQDLLAAAPHGRFRVGPVLVRTALILADRLDVTRVARPILDRVTEQTGETAILCLYAPARRQFWAVAAAESGHTIRYIWESLRDWNDLHVGSSGKGILAFLPAGEQDEIIERLPDPIPGLRPLSHDELRRDLATARDRGFVVSHGERFEGAIGVSAPIFDATQRVIGDIVVSWPDNRTSAEREADVGLVARDAAAAISRGLGWSEARP